jgi:PadR family transcriptional regulator, regulatory protein PadR
MANDPLALIRGTLDLLVLKALSWGPMHGCDVATWLERGSNGSLGVDDSALYQALHRLEGRGLLESEWGVSENNRRAKYYTMTPAGRRHLRVETSTWEQYSRSVTAILSLKRQHP